MRTAVQLQPIGAVDLPRCDLVCGEPLEVVAGGLGSIALFGPGELVGYRLRSFRRTRLYVMRTLGLDDPRAAAVPGVKPHVRLLIDLRTAGRARLMQRLFAYLARTGCDPSRLSDAFYLRVGVVLAGRLPPQKLVRSLLNRERGANSGGSPPGLAPRRPSCGPQGDPPRVNWPPERPQERP